MEKIKKALKLCLVCMLVLNIVFVDTSFGLRHPLSNSEPNDDTEATEFAERFFTGIEKIEEINLGPDLENIAAALWQEFQDEYFLYTGTSSNNLETIKQHGLSNSFKPFERKDVEFYEKMHEKAFGTKQVLGENYRSNKFYLTLDQGTAESYADTGPEVVYMMLVRIPRVVKTGKLNQDEERQLRQIYEKYRDYMWRHRPVVLSVKGSAFRDSGNPMFATYYRFRSAIKLIIDQEGKMSKAELREAILANLNIGSGVAIYKALPEEIKILEMGSHSAEFKPNPKYSPDYDPYQITQKDIETVQSIIDGLYAGDTINVQDLSDATHLSPAILDRIRRLYIPEVYPGVYNSSNLRTAMYLSILPNPGLWSREIERLSGWSDHTWTKKPMDNIDQVAVVVMIKYADGREFSLEEFSNMVKPSSLAPFPGEFKQALPYELRTTILPGGLRALLPEDESRRFSLGSSTSYQRHMMKANRRNYARGLLAELEKEGLIMRIPNKGEVWKLKSITIGVNHINNSEVSRESI